MRTSNLKNVGGHATYKDRCVLNKIELRKKEGCVRMLTTKPRGTNDLLPQELEKWHYVENIMREVATLTVIRKFAHLSLNIQNFFKEVGGNYRYR